MRSRSVQLLVVLTATIGILYSMGRVIWCSCGKYYLWSGKVHSSHNSQHLFDAYSFSHFQHGLFFYFVLSLAGYRSFLLAMTLEAAWEILENTPLIIERYRAATFSLNYYGDSIFNSVGDILCCAFGYYLTTKLPWKITLAIYIMVEIAMLLIIKDSLTLNVIMLIYPLQAIKEWQSS